MPSEPRLSFQTIKVLAAFLEAMPDHMSGSDILRVTGLKTGTLYPILARLETHGWLESDWETEEPASLGRPRRRYYNLTAEGQQSARDCLSQLSLTSQSGAPA